MKGVILAGGKGTRLHPLTTMINKHLLPVGKFPMVYWPLLKLREANIREILIVTNEEHVSSFIRLLGDGTELGLRLSYTVQQQARGIADAIAKAEAFLKGEPFITILGDNIFEASLKKYIENFQQQKVAAKLLLTKVENLERYGIAILDKRKETIVSLIEKPTIIKEEAYCVTGIYMFDEQVFHYIKNIQPSKRGELEITDVNQLLLRDNKLHFDILKGWWIDAGTHESLFQANVFVNQGERGEV